jgi:hypothetical protein
MSTGRKPFDTQPLQPPIFGEETEVSAQRVVPLPYDEIKTGGRGRYSLSTWAALLVVVIAICAGLVAGLVIGAYGDHNTAQTPGTSSDTQVLESAAAPPDPAPSTSAGVEPVAGDSANNGELTGESAPGEISTPKSRRAVSVVHNDRVSEKPAKKTASRESAAREDKEERPRRAQPVGNERAVERNGKRADAESVNENQQPQEERRRERDVRQAERPRRVTESQVDRIQDIFMGPRPRH